MSLSDKGKPILFNTEMVKAILDGRKTQTRRVVNKEYLGLADIDGNNIYIEDEDGNHFNILETTWAKYKVDDILYVRETFKTFSNITMNDEVGVIYKADNKEVILPCNKNYECEYVFFNKWRPSIHMPKKYARIFLKVINVRVERLQDIDNDGFFAEGFKQYSTNILLENFNNGTLSKLKDGVKKWWIELWNSTAKDGYKWEDNPYVFVYEFERLKNVI